MTPQDLRKEADAAEVLARVVSYGRDKEQLIARAAELRLEAERLEGRSFQPAYKGGEPPLRREA